MDSTENRLKTLNHWPVKFISAEKMADSGFYYEGNTDTVHCFSCKVSLSNWKKEYVPNDEHKKHSPNCKHLREVSQDPVYPEYESISARQETFNDWKYGHIPSPESFYNDGFFHSGEGICICYHCGTRIMIKWNRCLDPSEVHKEFSPNCKFFDSIKIQTVSEDLTSKISDSEDSICKLPVSEDSSSKISGSDDLVSKNSKCSD